MRRKIPSTTALISFEAAARHESFTKAAQELSITQGAICRQIASLEEFLSVELFRRSRRGVKLTEAGLSYSRIVVEGSFSLVDALGNAKEAIVVHAEYPRELVDQINWTNFLNKNVYVVAENVKLHPLFRDE